MPVAILSPTPSESDRDLIFPTDEPSGCIVDKVFLIVSGIVVVLFAGLLGTVFMVFFPVSKQKHQGCSDGHETATNVDYCYRVHPNHSNFSSAEHHCHQENGTLAYALNTKNNEFLAKIFRKHSKEGHDFFMGIRCDSDNKWKLINGTGVSYFNWDIGMPTNNATGTVVVVQTETGKNGTWKNVNVREALPFICQTEKRH